MTEFEAWIPPEALAHALDGPVRPVVLDVRFSLAEPAAGERAWRAARIPGAFHAHLERDLSGPHRPDAGRHPWPTEDDFRRQVAAWGITPATPVVLYDDADGALAAARAWYLLRLLGHGPVAVLDGGWKAWQAAGGPVDTGPAPRPRPAAGEAYPGRFAEGRLLDADAVGRHLAGGGVLVDARAPERYRGDVEPIDPVGGHVPGARNRPFAANLEHGRARPARVLREAFESLADGHAPADMVVMCGSGVTACHHLLAMAHAGLPLARLYAGSWSGWIEDPTRPIARGPAA
ncbi:sulfurtransferase [Lysobacter sp. SG-8]|uniref:Sulfurtransferase n=1 Tax=Marilutibacter penaei TaxID=2759900 RepID=A0A7W3U5M1_9GAMM|nr:sulfurtransferase [Lysobacter penaei]MBB1089332.1 sulfurtransferase [Lysobacter penaei]